MEKDWKLQVMALLLTQLQAEEEEYYILRDIEEEEDIIAEEEDIIEDIILAEYIRNKSLINDSKLDLILSNLTRYHQSYYLKVPRLVSDRSGKTYLQELLTNPNEKPLYETVGMKKATFLSLTAELKRLGLKDSQRSSNPASRTMCAEEKVAVFLYILGNASTVQMPVICGNGQCLPYQEHSKKYCGSPVLYSSRKW
jgi:hypothetical protein